MTPRPDLEPTIQPTEFEWHRAAAWFAGEGAVSYGNRKLQVSLSQKEGVVCEWLRARFGGSSRLRKANATHNEITYWTVCGDKARAFLRGIQHLMPESPRRTEQVRAALEATEGRRKTGTKPSLLCKEGHEKPFMGARCKECALEQQRRYRLQPEALEKHRLREHARYHARKEDKNANVNE